ncbi:MAG: DUF5106 domain-containing protein [Lewinellaceae bacterium]|nr:DUF5106 domain-containing protein [Lewinellaceae bacterium]
MTKRLVFALLFILGTMAAHATPVNGPVPGGLKIRVKLENYPETQLLLGYHFGDKQYVKDTVDIGADGYFTFSSDTLLECGVYLLVMKPDNSFIQVILPADDQDFTLTTDAKDPVGKMKVKGSEENALFYDYMRYLNDRRPEADSIKALLTERKGIAADSIRLSKALEDIDVNVKKYQANLLAKQSNMLFAKVINASIEPEVPLFKGEEKAVQRQRYYYYRDHFFDNISLTDDCLIRSPVLFQKVDQFINKVTPQHPDSLNLAIDNLLGKMGPSSEAYKFFLIHFLNYYAKSNIVGMDAVYVHIAKNYYCVGKAPWTNAEDLEKICDNANRLEPILIGKIAPNITVKDKGDKPLSLWDIDADYTILFFWDPECSHCKKAAPFMVDFAKNTTIKT